jgi:hypothetical protein
MSMRLISKCYSHITFALNQELSNHHLWIDKAWETRSGRDGCLHLKYNKNLCILLPAILHNIKSCSAMNYIENFKRYFNTTVFSSWHVSIHFILHVPSIQLWAVRKAWICYASCVHYCTVNSTAIIFFLISQRSIWQDILMIEHYLFSIPCYLYNCYSKYICGIFYHDCWVISYNRWAQYMILLLFNISRISCTTRMLLCQCTVYTTAHWFFPVHIMYLAWLEHHFAGNTSIASCPIFNIWTFFICMYAGKAC